MRVLKIMFELYYIYFAVYIWTAFTANIKMGVLPENSSEVTENVCIIFLV